MLATSHNRLAAQLVGIDVRRVLFASFGLAAALGAVGGVLIAPIAFTSYDAGIMLGLKGFAAAMLGGLGSFRGAIAGGLTLGVLESARRGLPVLGLQGCDRVRDPPRRPAASSRRTPRCAPKRPRLARPARARARGACSVMRGSRRSRVVAALLPLLADNGYFYDLAIIVAFNAIVCVGLNLLIGYAGQISLGHAASSGSAATASALLAAQLRVAAARRAGRRGRRRRAPRVRRRRARSCGSRALPRHGDARPRHHRRRSCSAPKTASPAVPTACRCRRSRLPASSSRASALWYAIALGALLLAVLLASNLVDSPAGRALRALHTSEVAAQVAGIDTAHYKLLAFVVSAVFAAVAGGLSAFLCRLHHAGEAASFLHSIEFVTMVVFGGMASTCGAIVGAARAHRAAAGPDGAAGYEMIVFGALLMATMIFLPRGIVPTLASRAALASRSSAGASDERECAASRRKRDQVVRRRHGDRRRDVRREERRRARDHRTQRRRQDDAHQPVDRVSTGRARAHRVRQPRPHAARRRTRSAAPASARTFQNLQIFFNMSVARERHDRPAPARAQRIAAALLRTPRARAQRARKPRRGARDACTCSASRRSPIRRADIAAVRRAEAPRDRARARRRAAAAAARRAGRGPEPDRGARDRRAHPRSRRPRHRRSCWSSTTCASSWTCPTTSWCSTTDGACAKARPARCATTRA